MALYKRKFLPGLIVDLDPLGPYPHPRHKP